MQLLQCTASPPKGGGQWNSCNALPHRLGAVGNATPAIHCLIAREQWVVELLFNTASLPWGSGLWSSRSYCNAVLLCLGIVGSATPCLTAWGQWAVQLVQHGASRRRGRGQRNSCYTQPHCLGKWAVELL